jgi:hypothetical protein
MVPLSKWDWSGKEGMVGMQALLGGNTMPNQAFVQVPGQATRIRTEHLQVEFDRGGALQKLLLRYVQALYTQVSQTAACNRLHTIEARLARWLLLVRYSLEADEIPLTQEYISQMLGTRRAGVTEAASDLQKAGLIRYRRGRITILDPADLEAVACECYQVVRDEFDRLLGEAKDGKHRCLPKASSMFHRILTNGKVFPIFMQ